MENKLITVTSLLLSIIVFTAGVISHTSEMTLGSAAAFLCVLVIYFLNNKLNILPSKTYFFVVLFTVAALLLGKALNFYSYVPLFDKLLHFSSGIIIVFTGINLCKKANLSGVYYYVFILSFAIALAGIWEFFEFFMDSVFNMSCQNNSLKDTMFDMIAGTFGAIITVVLKNKP